MSPQIKNRLRKILFFLRFTNPEVYSRLLKMIISINNHERHKERNSMSTVEESQTPLDTSQLSRLKALDIVAFNSAAEDLFVILIANFIKEEGPQLVSVICAEAAFELNISTETAKRYLMKHSARRAEFEIKDKLVSLRKEVNQSK